jgi:tetratricopeptide (TPR) repeat protein
MGYALAVNCEFDKALHHIEQILNFHIKANSINSIVLMKSLKSHLVYNWKGDIQTACQITQDAVSMADEIQDLHPKVFAYACHGVNLFTKGHFGEAKNYLAQAFEFNKRVKQFWWNMGCNHYLGDVYYDRGEYRKATNYYLEAINLLKSTNVYPGWLNMNQVAFARANAKIDKKSINLSFLSTYAAENKLKMLDGKINRYISEIYLQYDTERTDEAEKWIIQAIKADSKNGMSWQLGQDHAIYAKLCNRKGDLSKAQENLVKAIEIFKECGADGWVEKYEKDLPEV